MASFWRGRRPFIQVPNFHPMILRSFLFFSFFLFSIIVTAQDYNGWWAEVNELINKGQPKSALERLKRIHDTAQEESNGPMLVKALIHEIKLKGQYEEYSLQRSIERIDSVIVQSKAPVTNILHSMLGEMYWGYYQQNRWQFHHRTSKESASDNIATWDFNRIVKTADRHYRKSLTGPEALKASELKDFESILQGRNDYRELRPSLYHLLLSRAMDFYGSEEQDLLYFDKHGYYSNAAFLGSAEVFLDVVIDTNGTLEPAKRTAFLFQELIRSASANQEALVLEDLRRLEFMHQRSTADVKDSLYRAQLDGLLSTHQALSVSMDVRYAIGQMLFNQGNGYDVKSNDDKTATEWKEAHRICSTDLKKFPNSIGAKNCKALLSQIEQRNINIAARQVILPNKDFLVKLDYRNVGSNDLKAWPVYAKLASINPEKLREEQRGNYGDKLIRWLKTNSAPVAEVSFEVPNPGDFHQHGIELPFEGLDMGTYVVFLGTDKKLNTSNEAVAYAIITVSNLATIQQEMPDNNTRLAVKFRDNGHAVKGATVNLITQYYDRGSRTQKFKIKETLNTDENGEVFWKHPGSGRHENLIVDVIYNEDELLSSGNLYTRYYNDRDQWMENTRFFLDRAIYRPGQTVNFKGIITSSDGMENKVVSNKSTTVRLFDANGQEVSKLDQRTNEYGTFSGTFILPNTGLNGFFRIGNENGSHSFRMEEYKRPRFEVTLEQPTDQFRVGDTISVSGAAMTYSGVALPNADFNYRVVRNTSFPYRWLCWYWQPQSQQKTVAFGSGTTNENGQLQIDFEALPDNSVNRWYKPVFSYTIEVDVVDISGEVQSTTATVAAGYHALNLSMDLSGEIEKENLGEYEVTATNLSGIEQEVDVTVKVWTLKHPDRPYRQRKWTEPDQQLLSETEFKKRFFNDPYRDEANYHTWEKDRNMLDTKFRTSTGKAADLKPLRNLPSGQYLVEITAKDAFGTELKQVQYYTLYDRHENQTPFQTTNWLKVEKPTLEPGEELKIFFGSSYKDVKARLQVEVKEKGRNINSLAYDEQLLVNGSATSVKIPVTDQWRGNAQVYVTFVYNNEVFNLSRTITVPYTNRQLEVKLETFRKEMSPDDEEEWTITIKDKEGKPSSAELLTTMYDASLDVLAPNNWSLNLDNYLQPRHAISSSNFGLATRNIWDKGWRIPWESSRQRMFEQLNWFGHHFGGGFGYRNRGLNTRMEAVTIASYDAIDADFAVEEMEVAEEPRDMSGGMANGKLQEDDSVKEPEVALRSDFSETVFFHRHLTSNENGEIELSFKAPQSLTKWKFMALATSNDLKIGTTTEEVVTRKQLMVTPNYPRFLREGDKLVFQAKVNLLDTTVFEATASLDVKDGLTLEPLQLKIENRQLSIANGQAVARWEIEVPEGISALQFTTKAWGTGHNENGQTRTHSDGEEKTIPVLPNRMLVTEALPLPVRGKGTYEFTFEHLDKQFGLLASSSLNHENLALEFTPNPIWLAVLALPYMMEYPYECSEQLFSRYYANAIGTNLANSDPAIKRVFDQWKRDAEAGMSNALESQLDKNPELKQVLLNETPWVRDAQDEGERRKRLALLFDTERMSTALASTLKKLKANQKGDGGWGWFGGMRSNPYITRYIVAGFGKLRKMGVWQPDEETLPMIEKAVRFLDREMVEDWNRKTLHEHPSHSDLHTLYTRSFWVDDFNLKGHAATVHSNILKKVEKHWVDLDAFQKGMAAVVLHRNGKKSAAQVIVSLRETALSNEEFGMYWAMDKGYYWYHAPIENHVMILEAFHEVAKDKEVVDEMKIWLLKQKQTQDWKTTKATAEACYALLSTGNVNLNVEPLVSINLGQKTIDPRTEKDLKAEAGTGYFKKSFSGDAISNGMQNITVTKDDEGVSWGAVYWQFFEDLDKIGQEDQNPISISRELFYKMDTDEGPVLMEFEGDDRVEVGETYTVVVTLHTDRNMEFVHLKDMRAASFEPRQQLSGVQSQEGLTYYQSPTDVAMNFFFDYLPKGTFVFEYDLNATQVGDFSNGISQVQCMYAPEFTTHSEGMRVEVR